MNKIESTVDNFNKGVVEGVKSFMNNSNVKFLISIISFVIVVYCVYKAYNFIILKAENEPFIMKGYHVATTPYIHKKKLPKPDSGNGFSVIFWMYVSEWGYRQSKPKHVLHIGDKNGHSVSPGVWLYPENNNVLISYDDYSRDFSSASMNPEINPTVLKVSKPCDVIDIPIQRWIQFGLILNNKTIDVYMNGKLRRSCTLENVPRISDGSLYVTQWGGFKGFVSDVQYINRPVSSWEAYRIYRGSADRLDVNRLLASTINTIIPKVKIDFEFNIDNVEDNTEDVTVENFV